MERDGLDRPGEECRAIGTNDLGRDESDGCPEPQEIGPAYFHSGHDPNALGQFGDTYAIRNGPVIPRRRRVHFGPPSERAPLVLKVSGVRSVWPHQQHTSERGKLHWSQLARRMPSSAAPPSATVTNRLGWTGQG